MQALILGDGPFGRAVADALAAHGVAVRVAGRPAAGTHDPSAFAGVDVVVDASRGDSVLANVAAAVGGGVRRLAIATTAWESDRRRVAELLRERGAAAVAASNFSPGALVFAQLVEAAARLAARLPGYEPGRYLVGAAGATSPGWSTENASARPRSPSSTAACTTSFVPPSSGRSTGCGSSAPTPGWPGRGPSRSRGRSAPGWTSSRPTRRCRPRPWATSSRFSTRGHAASPSRCRSS